MNEYTGLNESWNSGRRRLNIDSSTRCNLSCPGCSRTRSLAAGSNKWQVTDMKMSDFQALVAENNNILRLTYNLTLSDPIYSGSFIKQLEHLNTLTHRPRIIISTNASGRNVAWWLKLARLLAADDKVEFAIDGLSDTNHIYRVNSEWDTIMLGANTLRENWTGRMVWRYVIFEHNYHQIGQAKQLSKSIGFDAFRAVVGDGRTPEHMRLHSVTWEEINANLS